MKRTLTIVAMMMTSSVAFCFALPQTYPVLVFRVTETAETARIHGPFMTTARFKTPSGANPYYEVVWEDRSVRIRTSVSVNPYDFQVTVVSLGDGKHIVYRETPVGKIYGVTYVTPDQIFCLSFFMPPVDFSSSRNGIPTVTLILSPGMEWSFILTVLSELGATELVNQANLLGQLQTLIQRTAR